MSAFHGDRSTILTQLAREAIGERLGFPIQLDVEKLCASFPWLKRLGATFVTLTLDGALRGCIGTLEASRPLLEDLRGNARSAAFKDPRFWPLAADEFERIEVEVSVLSELTPLPVTGLDDACAKLKPNVDGVVLEDGPYRATFLPQVWEELPDPREFLRNLRRKAGLKPDHWSRNLRLWTYGVEKHRAPSRQAPHRRSADQHAQQ